MSTMLKKIKSTGLLTLICIGLAVASVGIAIAATVMTDKPDYAPGQTVVITGTGWESGETVELLLQEDPLVQPDQIFYAVADSNGDIINTEFSPDPFDIGATFTLTATGQSSGLTATTTFTDVAFVSDFRQCANQDPTLGDCHWISNILIPGNSQYFEGMSVPQRLIFTNIPDTSNDVYILTFSHLATKGGIHAYDWLTSYNQADVVASLLGVPFTDLGGQACDDEIGPPGSLGATCDSLRASAFTCTIDVPDDPFISAVFGSGSGSTQDRIDDYETAFGNRTIKVYANAAITCDSLTLIHDPSANGSDTGDSSIDYELTWTSDADQILIEFAGHLAVSEDGGESWGAGLGSSFVDGGPYHVKLDLLRDSSDETIASLGSQDNQIQSGAVQFPSCEGVDCDDQDVCTTDTCEIQGGTPTCLHSTPPSCDDSDVCTTDTCTGPGPNDCNHSTPPSCDDSDVCTTDTCTGPGPNDCSHTPPPNCDDGNICTTDACGGPSAGDCTHSTPPNCDDGNICTTDACGGPSAGDCTHSTPPNCDDGNVCTTDACTGPNEGDCSNSTPPNCDDGIACTVDTCAGPDPGDCSHEETEDCICTRTIGFYKNHCDALPANLIIGCVNYSRSEMCTILNTKATKADLQLIWQLIAAMANQANFGAGCDAIADANDYISDLKTFAGKNQCGTNNPDRNLALSIASELDICNNSGEGFCDGDTALSVSPVSPEDTQLSDESASATGGCSLLTQRPTGLEYEKLAMLVILGLLPWAISRRRRVKVLQ